METKEIEVNGSRFVVRELLATEFDEIVKLDNSDKRTEELVKKSSSLTDEQYRNLTARERGVIINTINILNGWNEDFQKAQSTEEKVS